MGIDTVQRGVKILRKDGVREFADSALRHYRRRVRGPLSPVYPYLLSYENAAIEELADKVHTLQRPQSGEITYTGVLDEHCPPFVDNQDWLTENLGRKVYEFSNADIIGSTGRVFSENRHRPSEEGAPSIIRVGLQFILPSSIGTKNRRKGRSLKYIDRILKTTGVLRHWPSGTRPDRRFDLAFLLPTPYGQAYAAFQSDLFKLRAFERYRRASGEEPQLIIPSGPSELVEKYLLLMGYPPESYTTLQNETVQVDRLLVPSHRPRKGSGELQPSPSDRPWMRDRILSNLDLPDGPASRRIYVSRQDERRRRVVNIDEIRPILKKYDFMEYNPGNHPLEGQIRTFAGANLFVGPHGSGFMNCTFASDAAVVELLSTEHWRTSTVFVMAKDLGFEYEICPCESVEDSHGQTRHRDIIVDPGTLEETLERMIRLLEPA